jgi:hypothetical protein
LASAEPTKPTGIPMIAAGLGPPSAINSSRWNSAVGALPIATTAPSSSLPHKETAAADRVVPQREASPGTPSSCSRQRTSFLAGSRRRVMPEAIIRASVKIGAPTRSASRAVATSRGWNAISAGSPTSPVAWIIRTATTRSSSASSDRSASARMVAKDRR